MFNDRGLIILSDALDTYVMLVYVTWLTLVYFILLLLSDVH